MNCVAGERPAHDLQDASRDFDQKLPQQAPGLDDALVRSMLLASAPIERPPTIVRDGEYADPLVDCGVENRIGEVVHAHRADATLKDRTRPGNSQTCATARSTSWTKAKPSPARSML